MPVCFQFICKWETPSAPWHNSPSVPTAAQCRGHNGLWCSVSVPLLACTVLRLMFPPHKDSTNYVWWLSGWTSRLLYLAREYWSRAQFGCACCICINLLGIQRVFILRMFPSFPCSPRDLQHLPIWLYVIIYFIQETLLW